MKRFFLIYISFFVLGLVNSLAIDDACDLGKLVDEAWFNRFIDDLESSGGEKLRQAIKEDVSIIDSWRLANEKRVADALRKNPEFLKHYDDLTSNSSLKKHVFDGKINKKNSVKRGAL